ncbi:MAG: caspase family protein [Steroidobacteraceae bacterium]
MVGIRTARAELTDADLRRMRAESRVALVIGNGGYRDFDELPNPPNDARGVADALKAAGFKVTLRVDANREQMLQAIDAFGRDLAHSQVGLFYFAGHAAQVDWRNFIVPVAASLAVDAKGADRLANQVAQQAVELGTVLDLMGKANNRLNIVIIDACRNNPFTSKAMEVGRSLSRSANKTPFRVSAGLAQTFAPPRTFLAYATAPGEVASDGAGRNSPYSGALIEALAVPDLKLEDVFKRVRNSVAGATANAQIPWDNSSVFDDFYFRIPANVPAAAERKERRGLNTTFVSP